MRWGRYFKTARESIPAPFRNGPPMRIPDWAYRYVNIWPTLSCRRDMSGSVPIQAITDCAEMFGLNRHTLLQLVDEAMIPAQLKYEKEKRPK